jgi:Asp-tRNA(Asn)/Glu-tRNA(Gln) amidotransferase A subunit family amidase
MSHSIPPTKAARWRRSRAPTDWVRYAQAVVARDRLRHNIATVMADHGLDAIVHKTVEYPPPSIKDGTTPPYAQGTGYIFSLNTYLIDWSAITVPSGFTADGLPAGITFIGRPFAEPSLIRLAYAYEQATRHRQPPATTPELEAKTPSTSSRLSRP